MGLKKGISENRRGKDGTISSEGTEIRLQLSRILQKVGGGIIIICIPLCPKSRGDMSPIPPGFTSLVKWQNLIGNEKMSRLRDDEIEKFHVVLTDVAAYNRTVEASRVVELRVGEKEEVGRWLRVREELIQEEELREQQEERFEEVIQNEAEKQQGETGQESKELTQTREEGVNKNVGFVAENLVNLLGRILTSFKVGVLSRGLNFCPIPKEINMFEFIKVYGNFGGN